MNAEKVTNHIVNWLKNYAIKAGVKGFVVGVSGGIDGDIKNMESKAMLLSVWDGQNKDTYKINLWTKEMPVNEMIQFFHQTLISMSDSFELATGDEKMSATMRDFCDYYAEKMGIKKQ